MPQHDKCNLYLEDFEKSELGQDCVGCLYYNHHCPGASHKRKDTAQTGGGQGESIAGAVVTALREHLPRLFQQFSPVLSTGAATPVLGQGSSSSHLTAPPETVAITDYSAYTLPEVQLNRKYYNDAKRKIEEFSSQQDKEQYSVHCSRNHIWVRNYPTNKVVYKCSVSGVAPRNFLLELHASGYIIPTWLERRQAGFFDSMDYVGSTSPLGSS